MSNIITIKFKTNSILENHEYEIDKSLLKKYPNSIFNFCIDFDQNVIEFDTHNISYEEFGHVLNVMNGTNLYWQIKNKKITRFIHENGLIDNNFEMYKKVQKTRTNNELEKLDNFIYGKQVFYTFKDMDFYNEMKDCILQNEHIVSVQYLKGQNCLININESLPIYRLDSSNEKYIARCPNNMIDINETRYTILSQLRFKNKIMTNLYSDDNEQYLGSFVATSISHEFGTHLNEKYNIDSSCLSFIDKPTNTYTKIFKWSTDVLSLFGNDSGIIIPNLVFTILNNNNIPHFRRRYNFFVTNNGIRSLSIPYDTCDMEYFFVNLKNICKNMHDR